MNLQLFHAINNLADQWHWLDVLGIFLADKFIYIFALIILALWFNKQLRNYVYLAFASAFVSRIIIVEVIKRLVNHPRPYEIVPNIHQLLADNEHGMSFPSGHTVIFFSFAFAFWGTRLFWPFLVLAILGSVARIFVGVHFPYDILASVVIAGLVVLGLRRLFKKQNLG
jgi:undecaprenyl-diphosphatase